jgi:hypothetical protein
MGGRGLPDKTLGAKLMDPQIIPSGECYDLVEEEPPAPVPTIAPAPVPTPPAAPEEDRTKDTAQGQAKTKGRDTARAKGQAKPKTARPRPGAAHRWDLPAWGVSLLVHLALLSGLALATLHPEVRRTVVDLNTALVARDPGAEPEPLPILADPADMPREEAVGSSTPTLSQGIGAGVGPAAPTATPSIGVGAGSGVGPVTAESSLPGIKVVGRVSSLSLLPATPTRSLGGGGMIAGDVTYETQNIGSALDQLAREILRHLEAHKLTVVWLFDESGSMKDDQKEIKEKFDRVASELKLNIAEDKKSAGALNHAIVGFGNDIHFVLEKPTTDIDLIGRAIDRLRVDDTGVENTMQALQTVIARYGRLISKDRRLLIVLVTDESGDDGSFVEEARQAAVSRGVPIYVIGRQSMFGYDRAHLVYVDPVTKDTYWPAIRRGPETADVETLQWDGLHRRYDEQPSGFAPYELARITKDSGGIYFLLPTEETMRARVREKAYSIRTLKEYVPEYLSRTAYMERREHSDLRRTMFDIIKETRDFGFRTTFPIEPDALVTAALPAMEQATIRLNQEIAFEKQLRALEKLRDREPEKRWQANYDLMLAQLVASEVKAYEYRACLQEMVQMVQKGQPPRPSKLPSADLTVYWELHHSRQLKAPKEQTAKKIAEAERLLKLVIERHPHTPWADLAQDFLDRGFGVQWNEHSHSTRYAERQKLVPNF